MLYKHVKRGTLYTVLSEAYHLNDFSLEGSVHTFFCGAEKVEAEFQFSGEGRYAGPIVVYKGTDNKVWMRPTFEFHDGRFEEVKS